MTSTTDQFGHEVLASEIISGRGRRFAVEASDDAVIGGRAWHVRIYEIKTEPRRGEVRDVRMCAKCADRVAAIALAEQVIAKVKQQVA